MGSLDLDSSFTGSGSSCSDPTSSGDNDMPRGRQGVVSRLLCCTFALCSFLALNSCELIDSAAADSIIVPYKPSEAELREQFPRGITPAEYGLSAAAKTITVSPDISLQAWFMSAESARATIIVLHGFGGAKSQQLGAAEMLLKSGYNVVLYDARAHGKSGGKYCTHGVRERHDLVQIIDSATQVFGADLPLGLLGHSYGGSVVLQTMAIDKRVDCGVVESTYSSLRAAVNDYMDKMPGLGQPSVRRNAYALAAERAAFDPDSANNIWAARKISVPIFLSHGTADERLDFDNGERLRDVIAPELLTWRPVEGAGHNTVWQYGGEAYKGEILAFFAKHLRAEE